MYKWVRYGHSLKPAVSNLYPVPIDRRPRTLVYDVDIQDMIKKELAKTGYVRLQEKVCDKCKKKKSNCLAWSSKVLCLDCVYKK